MARIYKTKGPNAKTAKVTVPVSPGLLEQLKQYALAVGLTPTATARKLIEQGLARHERRV